MKTQTVTYTELLQQRAVLEQQIAAARKAEVAQAIQKARALVEAFSLTQADVFQPAKSKREIRLGAPKYRDPMTGRTWTGRGRLPDWIKNQNREQFAI